MKITAIVQARVGSTRLPGKVLKKILGKTILEYGIERIQKAKYIKNIVIATPDKKRDLKIVKLVKKLGIDIYRGSEKDVLDRYYQAAKHFKTRHIARITSDCPIIDPQVIDAVAQRYLTSKADYCSNNLEDTFPDGQDVEIFSFAALKNAWENARLLSEREHVTPYIKKHPEKFKLASFKNKVDLSSKRWTVDEPNDFALIKAIIEALYPQNPDFQIKDVLRFLSKNPELEKLNQNIIRNEGYLKSLKEDKIIKNGALTKAVSRS